MNENTMWKILIIAIILLLLSDFIFYKSIYERGYIDACKDFYQGKLKYDLVEFPDGTKEWKKIENN